MSRKYLVVIAYVGECCDKPHAAIYRRTAKSNPLAEASARRAFERDTPNATIGTILCERI